MKITIDVTSEQAEELLIGLAHRAQQDRVHGTFHADEIISLGTELDRVFKLAFKWTTSFSFIERMILSRPVRVRVSERK